MADLAFERRAVDPALESALAVLLAGEDPSFCIETNRSEIAARVADTLCVPILAADMVALAHMFAKRTGADRLKLRFERVVGPACKYFHVDMVDRRLITTYAGPGTEYVPARFANRAALGMGDNRRVVPDPSKIVRLPTYAVAYFRGEAAPGNRGKGDIHRSPPASPKNPRLVFVVDPVLEGSS